MKTTIRLFALTAMMVAMLAHGVLAQTADSQTTTAASGAQSEEDAKRDAYVAFIAKYKADKPAAYQIGKDYLQKYPSDNSKQAQFVKKWVAAYEEDQKTGEVIKVYNNIDQLITGQKFAEAYAASKQYLGTNPNDLRTLLSAAYAGWRLSFSGKNSSDAETANYARQAIQLIEAGKTPVEGQAFDKKNETLGWLNYALGTFALNATSPEAGGYFVKAAQFEGYAKKDPQLYERLALSYQATEYTKLAADYAKSYDTEEKRATPEGKAATAQINDVVDRIVDAYARAVAYSGTDQRYAAKKAEWTKQLTDFYKFRHDNSIVGLDQLIASVTTKPLPQPGQPVSVSPATTTSSTTAQPSVDASGTAGNAMTPAAGTATKATTTTKTTTNVTTQSTRTATTPAATSTRTVSRTTTAPATTKSKTTTTTTTKRP